MHVTWLNSEQNRWSLIASSTHSYIEEKNYHYKEMEIRFNLETVLESALWHLGFMNASITSLISCSPSGSWLLPKPSSNYEKSFYETNKIYLGKSTNCISEPCQITIPFTATKGKVPFLGLICFFEFLLFLTKASPSDETFSRKTFSPTDLTISQAFSCLFEEEIQP